MIEAIPTSQNIVSTPNQPRQIAFSTIPEDLKKIPRWVLWKYEPRDGKITKVPYRVSGTGRASSTDFTSWAPYDSCRKVYDLQSDRYAGIGLVLSEEDDLICVDLDNKESDQDKIPEYSALANKFGSFSEVSTSGKGIHIWCRGKKPGAECRRGDVEIYETGRFIAITGWQVPGTPGEVRQSQEAIDELYKKVVEKPRLPRMLEDSSRTDEYTDEEIITLAGKENQKFSRLFRGDTSGYDSHSSADIALCNILAWYSKDIHQIDRIFRHSGLNREKWDREDYRIRTIGDALKEVTGHRERNYRPPTLDKPATKTASKKKSAPKPDEDDEEPKRHLPYFEKDGKLYLTCISQEDKYSYAHLDCGIIVFTHQELDPMGYLTIPPELPIHQDRGNTIYLVGLPRSDLLSKAELLSPCELYSRIRDHFYKYFDAPEIEYELFVYYALYSWYFSKCGTTPYLRFLGDTGKGKSRFLKTISDLCFYPVRASGSSSLSGLMRFKERWQGSLLIDESDLKGDQTDPLIKYLNLGFEKDNPFLLTDKNDVSKCHIFDPFGPKVIAMRQPFRDNATEGRCLSFSPSETNREDIPPELPSGYFEEVAELRALICRFTLEHWHEVSEECMISLNGCGFEGRMKQMARPLSIILKLFPDGEERFRAYLTTRQQEIKQVRAESWEGSMFNYALQLATGDEDLMIDPEFGKYYYGGKLQAVLPKMVSESLGIKPTSVTRALKGMGFEVEQKRVIVSTKDGSTSKNVRPLLIKNKQKWKEITQRYYANEDGGDIPDCPECMRGPEYSTKQNTLSSNAPLIEPVTDVSVVSLPLYTPNAENEVSIITTTEDPVSYESATTVTSDTPLKTSPGSYSEWLKYHQMPEDTTPEDFTLIIDKVDRKGSVCHCKRCEEPHRSNPLYWNEKMPKYARPRICQPHKNEMVTLWKKEHQEVRE